MTRSPNSGKRRLGTIAVVVAAAFAAGPMLARAANPQTKANQANKGKAKGKKPPESDSDQKAAKLQASVRRETELKPSGVKMPERPAKVVSTPTLTHEGLDQLVEKFLETAKIPLATPTSDVEFVRRVCLDLTGKLPTSEQARGFVHTHEKDKRAKLIEYLLRSDDYSRNWARYWRDVVKFRATTQNNNRVLFGELEDWLADEIAKNTPWDEVAKGIITATGIDNENGAVNFALSHEAQAVELAGEVSRIFMGVQIQCAQCHDHPNDSWKRQQFHEFAAYFAGIQRKQLPKGNGPRLSEIALKKNVSYSMPDKKDPQKQIFVAPKFFLDPKGETLPNGLTAHERLSIAASYVTGQDNPWFAKAFVNRVWYVLMGEGFYSPVDDMGPERTAKAPEVIDALAAEFTKSGYDVRWLFRTILNSRAYQREVRSTFTAAGRTPFAAVSPSRLRADQIIDSLAQVLDVPIDGNGQGGGGGGKAKKKGGGGGGGLAKDLKGAAGKGGGGNRGGLRGLFNDLYGVDPSTPYDDVLGTIPQALYMMNAPNLNNAMRADANHILGHILIMNPTNRAALGALYLRALSREPTQKEAQTCLRYIEKVGDRGEAFEDILWSLINSTEFVTRR